MKGEKWEVVSDDRAGTTERMRVPGGWIYRWAGAHATGVAMCFVPEVMTVENEPPNYDDEEWVRF